LAAAENDLLIGGKDQALAVDFCRQETRAQLPFSEAEAGR
jgi:hypothetical protein